MITNSYNKRGQYTTSPFEIFLCFIVFLDLTAFFLLSFLITSFDNLAKNPPNWLLAILFVIMAADVVSWLYFKRRPTFRFVIHLLILVCLIISLTVQNVFVLKFLSFFVFVRLPQIAQFNSIIKSKLHPYHGLFVGFTFLKIFYLFTLVSHIFGCIFYAIDTTLIQAQYYGKIQQYPSRYYQGQLLCYTPICLLTQLNQYLYCMYYLVSLLSTIAFGDIIPKNPYQLIYVCFLLVFSTVFIAFIIQQLMNTLGARRNQTYIIIKKMNYLNSMLQQCPGVSNLRRLNLIGYLLQSMKYNLNNNPNFSRLTNALQEKIMKQSFGLKQITHTLSSTKGKHKILNLQIYQQYSLPAFLAQCLLLKLQLKSYPANYVIIDNQNLYQPPAMYLTLSGQLTLGYSNLNLLRTNIKSKNKLICWRQFILNNKKIHPHFRVQTKDFSYFYTLTSDALLQFIIKNKQANQSNIQFTQFLQKYHASQMQQLDSIFIQSNQLDYNSKQIPLTAQNDRQPKSTTQGTSTHFLRCWICGRRTHYPDRCSNLHYKPNIHQILKQKPRTMNRQYTYIRQKRSGKKIRNNIKYLNNSTQSIKNKQILKQFISKQSQQLKQFKLLIAINKPTCFESYYSYHYFYYYYNIQSHF